MNRRYIDDLLAYVDDETTWAEVIDRYGRSRDTIRKALEKRGFHQVRDMLNLNTYKPMNIKELCDEVEHTRMTWVDVERITKRPRHKTAEYMKRQGKDESVRVLHARAYGTTDVKEIRAIRRHHGG